MKQEAFSLNKEGLFSLSTFRLSLSGAILGIAVMGLVSSFVYQIPDSDILGALIGGLFVLLAKSIHFF